MLPETNGLSQVSVIAFTCHMYHMATLLAIFPATPVYCVQRSD